MHRFTLKLRVGSRCRPVLAPRRMASRWREIGDDLKMHAAKALARHANPEPASAVDREVPGRTVVAPG
jgi:hypothetical protein